MEIPLLNLWGTSVMNNQPSGLDDFFNSSKDELEEKIKTTISDKKIIEILEDGK